MPTLTIIEVPWLFVQLAIASPTYNELVRLPRHVWGTNLVARDDTASIASTNAPNSKAVVFSFALESASCVGPDFSIKFRNVLIYAAAVIFHASESTWKKVMSFVLDFGEVVLGENGLTKRDIIPDIDEKFRLDLEATLPETIFKWQVRNPPLNGALTAYCDQCGTSGTLVFAGHVGASLGVGGVVADKLVVTVTPQGMKFVKPSQELEILEIPVSGCNISGIFELGPHIVLNAEYVIDYSGGSASVSSGITARIPDSFTLEISGWAPVIETDPLEIQIALSVSLSGPELTLTTTAGLDTNGSCEGGGNPYGVNIDASVGANLALEGWKELNDDRDTLFTAILFEKDDLYEFPSCLFFGTPSEGYCLPELPEDGMLHEELSEEEIAEDEEMGELSTRSLDIVELKKRPSGQGYKYKVLRYNTPTALQTEVTVPIVIPLISCNPGERGCVPNTGIDVLTEDGLETRAAAFVKELTLTTEHIYEGNLIREYLDHLHTEKFGNNSKTSTSNVTKPAAVQPPVNYIRSWLQYLGAEFTQAERMVLLAQKQNNHKFNLAGYFFQDKDSMDVDNNHERQACDLVRIVTTCNAKVDNSPNIDKLADCSFFEAHQEWLEKMYTAGIEHTRERLVDHAT
ncbi:hypothetical protein BDV06DRAFT_233838 [Aspergillus oleicola]